MLKFSRIGALAVVLIGSLAFVPPFSGYVRHEQRRILDYFDNRPQENVLFIGNSRTFYHDMPDMVRSIADSARYPDKLHIVMDAEPGVSLQDHMNDPETQSLLAQNWNHVVLQVLSSDQYSAERSGTTWDVAARLIRETQAKGSVPAMFVTWRYTDQCKANAGMPKSAAGVTPSGYANMHRNIQFQHARLAALTGVDLVNVGLVWEDLQSQPRSFSLYDDCNHPSIYGSYLSALMFYGYFSKREVADVTFKPWGISSEDAVMLRTVVSRYFKQAPLAAATKAGDEDHKLDPTLTDVRSGAPDLLANSISVIPGREPSLPSGWPWPQLVGMAPVQAAGNLTILKTAIRACGSAVAAIKI